MGEPGPPKVKVVPATTGRPKVKVVVPDTHLSKTLTGGIEGEGREGGEA